MATRWGICSAGKISNDFMVALQTLPAQDHQAMAVAAKDLKRAQGFAQTHNIPKVYGSYEELAKDPNIDIVYVGVLHTVHREVALMFLQNRKNVMCEKPLAMNSAEVKEMTAAARKHNVFFMEAMWSRFFPVYDQIRSLLSQKAIGDIKVVRAEFGSNQYHVPRAVGKELGGGALLDIGCYCIQFALMAFNGEKPESVTAKGFQYETGVDETVTIILQYPSKRQAILTCTIMVGMPNQAAICGSTGMIQVVAVAARDLNRAKEFAQSHNISKAYGTYEELAKDPDIDVVYVGAIHPVHKDMVLLFSNHGKNVLCEKPMAMNLTEVKEIISAARKHSVFLMEAFWSRFFPVYEEIRALLDQKVIGEVKLVRAEFGANLLGVPRAVEQELGGGALLDIGCYCIQFASMVFNGEKPESVTAKGFLHDTGVVETVTIILQYSGKRQAILTCTMATAMPNQAVISGTKGIIQIPSYMWSPTSLIVNGKETKYSLPPTKKHLYFSNSTGLSYEAEHVRQCLLKGLKESPIMSLPESEVLASIMEEVHVQLGVCKKSG